MPGLGRQGRENGISIIGVKLPLGEVIKMMEYGVTYCDELIAVVDAAAVGLEGYVAAARISSKFPILCSWLCVKPHSR